MYLLKQKLLRFPSWLKLVLISHNDSSGIDPEDPRNLKEKKSITSPSTIRAALSFIYYQNTLKEIFVAFFVFPLILRGLVDKSDRSPTTMEIELPYFLVLGATAREQNIICSKALLDGSANEQTIRCRQLFAGHVVDSGPMKRKRKMQRMIIGFIIEGYN